MRYSAADEQALMTELWSPRLADDPYAFVMFVFPWGQPNTPLEHKQGPREWQKRTLMLIRDHLAMNRTLGMVEILRLATASGRGIGKSALVAWLIIWFLSTRIGVSVIVSANSETQLRHITWGELTKWLTMSINSHWWDLSATRLVPQKWIASLVERDLRKGTRQWGAEGKLWSEENPDGYAGDHNMDGMMVIFDEASGIPDSIWGVAQGFFTELVANRFWFAFSNPRRNTGYFFDAFHTKGEFWQSQKIDSRTVEDTDKSVYDSIISEYGEDSHEARVEVYGEFPTEGDDQLISPAVVDEAMCREPWRDGTAPLVLGVDPARSGLDSTVLLLRQGRDVKEVRRYKGDDTMTVVGHIIMAIREWSPRLVVIDEGGLGYGILDRLNEQGFKVRGVNFGSKASSQKMWGNKRAEMWGAMKDWLKTASIPKDKTLKSDLIGPRRKPDSTGLIFLEGKKEMRSRGLASPDTADALAVTFAYPVDAAEDLWDSVVRNAVLRQQAADRDYDPWERAARELA